MYGLFLFFILLGLGFLGTQYYVKHESQWVSPHYSTAEIIRAKTLSHRLHQLQYQNADLEYQIAALKFQTASFLSDKSRRKIAYHRISHYLGLTQQDGPGVQLVLKDSVKPLLLGDNPTTGIIHNTDLLQVINELWAAGATGIAINRQPVDMRTSITCAGPVILMNGTRITSPFVIEAVGDPDKLLPQVQRSNGFLNELKQFDISVMASTKTVSIPASGQETTLPF